MTTAETLQDLVRRGVLTQTQANAALNQPSTFSSNYYGQSRDMAREDIKEGVMAGNNAAMSGSGIVDPNFVKTIMSDPSILGFYINAMTYGGYTVGDILNDVKRREMIKNNDVNAGSLSNLKLISADQTKDVFQKSPEGIKSLTASAQYLPTMHLAAGLDPAITAYATNIPDSLYSGMTETMDENSQEFKDKVEEVKSLYWDMQNAALQATNEQELAVAKANYDNFKKQINEKYGIILSDNADKAWKQIEDMGDSFNTRGLAGSGMQNEAVDTYLRNARKMDDRERHTKLDTEEEARAAKLKATGSPAEIAALTDEEKIKYGLKPSAETLALFNKSAIKAKFPNMTDKQIDNYISTYIDENGNFRSSVQRTYYEKLNEAAQREEADAKTKVRYDETTQQALDKKEFDKENVFNTISTSHIDPATNLPTVSTPDLVSDEKPSTELQRLIDAGVIQNTPEAIKNAQDAINLANGAGNTSETANSAGIPNNQSTTTPKNARYTEQQTKNLQDYLVSKGVMTQDQVNTGYGTFGPQTTAALNKFQTDNRLSLDVVGLPQKGAAKTGPATTYTNLQSTLNNIPPASVYSSSVPAASVYTPPKSTSTSSKTTSTPPKPSSYTPPKSTSTPPKPSSYTPPKSTYTPPKSTYTPPKSTYTPPKPSSYTPPKSSITSSIKNTVSSIKNKISSLFKKKK